MKNSIYHILFVLITFSNISVSKFPSCDVSNAELKRSLRIHKDTQKKGTSRLAILEQGQIWPRGEIYYSQDQRLTNDQIFMIYQAFSEYHKKTCIRFKPWKQNATQNYITITDSGASACSLSEVCMRGGQQLVQLGGVCWFKEMIIHQLGHTLCLGHEHQRPIRDWYLTFRYSCPEKAIPTKLDGTESQLGFYDYASQMHFACGWCSGGWPRNENVTGCGYQVTNGLSLLDADYINLLYDCGECHRHRWVPVDKLIPGHEKHMYSFGYKDRLGHPLYPCRVSFGGEIIIGKFSLSRKTCSFSLGGQEYYQTGAGTEVLLIPGGLRSPQGDSEYKVEQVPVYPDENFMKTVVPAGRLSEREKYGNGYIAFGRVKSPSVGEYEDTIGKAWERDGRIPRAFFPLGGKEVGAYYFKVLTCQNVMKK